MRCPSLCPLVAALAVICALLLSSCEKQEVVSRHKHTYIWRPTFTTQGHYEHDPACAECNRLICQSLKEYGITQQE